MRQLADIPARMRIDHRQLVVSVHQTVERRPKPVRHERNQPAIGRPGGLEIGVEVLGQSLELAAVEIIREEISDTSHLRAERDHFAVG